MPNYKEMYLTLFRANAKAVEMLIAAQRLCEEMYINEDQSKPKLIQLSQFTQEDNKE